MTTTADSLIPATDITDNTSVAVSIDGKNILICKANGDY